VGGSALHVASGRCLAVLLDEAAHALGTDPRDVTRDGAGFRAGGRHLSFADVARSAGGVWEEAEFWSPTAFPSGSYAAVVEVDVDTGVVVVDRIAAVDDVGVRQVPVLVEGQTLGSSVQGLGQALYEEVVYQEDGQPITSTLLDYLLPTASELPEIRTGSVETPNPDTPTGAKGAGEGGCIGVPPAVLNAVLDALRPLGVDELQMPATPGRVWEALQ
jgi:carbon-monoxide dehydrogenase large subunit